MLSIFLNALTVLSVAAGLIASTTAGGALLGNAAPLLFFTQQSNLLAGLVAAAAIFGLAGKKKALPRWFYTLKHVSTVGVTLTLLVFWFLLAPSMGAFYLTSVTNLTLHTVTPLLAIADHVFFDRPYREKKRHDLLACIEPVLYMLFAFRVAARAKHPAFCGGKFPYFFMDYDRLSWFDIGKKKFGVAWWIGVLFVSVCALSRVLRFLHRCAAKGRRART